MLNGPSWHAGWEIERRVGPVTQLVQREPASEQRRAVFCAPTDVGLVLGSTEAESHADALACAAAGAAIVKRSSGGGSVYVAPHAQVWLDLFVPSADPLFVHDVGVAAHFVGEVWADALERAGLHPASLEVHRGALIESRWSRLVCFAGRGAGEVFQGDTKLVGVAQRRSRDGAWFFSCAYLRSVIDDHLALLSPEAIGDLAAARAEFSMGVLDEHGDVLESALAASLGALAD